MTDPLFTKRGGYRQLDTFMLTTIIYYTTVRFCREQIHSFRQVEQMEQGGRSGRQNLAEGSERAATSTKTEMTLTDVARASIVELQLDFEDFINLQGEVPWKDDDPDSLQIKAIRLERTPPGPNIIHNFSLTVAKNRALFDKWLHSKDPIVIANAMVRLCDRADFLIRKQLSAQGKQFLEDGGFKERLTRHREAARADPEAPPCPKCDEPMRLRSARKGPRAGRKFWGCPNYPECDGLLDVDGG